MSFDQNDDDDATAVKLRSKNADENDYDAPEVNEELDDANDRESDGDEPNGDAAAAGDSEHSGDEDSAPNTSSNVVKDNMFANNYIYDRERHLWCELTFSVSLQNQFLNDGS